MTPARLSCQAHYIPAFLRRTRSLAPGLPDMFHANIVANLCDVAEAGVDLFIERITAAGATGVSSAG